MKGCIYRSCNDVDVIYSFLFLILIYIIYRVILNQRFKNKLNKLYAI